MREVSRHAQRKFARAGGRLVAVCRPKNVKRAIKLTHPQAPQRGTVAQLNEECGPYTFVGFASKRKVRPVPVLDHDGMKVGVGLAGDSFVALDDAWNDVDLDIGDKLELPG